MWDCTGLWAVVQYLSHTVKRHLLHYCGIVLFIAGLWHTIQCIFLHFLHINKAERFRFVYSYLLSVNLVSMQCITQNKFIVMYSIFLLLLNTCCSQTRSQN